MPSQSGRQAIPRPGFARGCEEEHVPDGLGLGDNEPMTARTFPGRRPADHIHLLTSDGIRISAVHVSRAASEAPAQGTPAASPSLAHGTTTSPRRDHVFVVAHGFTGSWAGPDLRRIVDVLAEHSAVIAFDFRGHGRSGGLSTVGDLEVRDLDAVVNWARRLGYRHVTTIGFSMGGAVALRHAGAEDAPTAHHPDSVVSVSSPAFWFYRGTVHMRRVHWFVGSPMGRAMARAARGTRIAKPRWAPAAAEALIPMDPSESAARITVPLLIVHGDKDTFFPREHGNRLAEAATSGRSPHVSVFLEEQLGHAEAAVDRDLLSRIATWALAAARPTEVPAHIPAPIPAEVPAHIPAHIPADIPTATSDPAHAEADAEARSGGRSGASLVA